ncbi:MAG TPA: lysine 2,3-aminomutase [Spirochaeta sp.]|nr:lysine 2,3-aminomutase [Spirochaeta sp.]
MKYKAYTSRNFEEIPQISTLSSKTIEEMKAVAAVFPFKTNNYVVEQLINWNNIPADPVYQLTFPQPGMLPKNILDKLTDAVRSGDSEQLAVQARNIQMEMNPQPAGQLELNVPEYYNQPLSGLQHKYRETVLFFPEHGQTCHAYCTYCFRWAQFIGIDELKMAGRETEILIDYLEDHPEVTDLLITGGDPMFMRTKLVRRYIEPILRKKPGGLQTIRIGTKALSYWPYRFTTDSDAPELLDLFREVAAAGFNLSVMAHFTHIVEMETEEAAAAIELIKSTGAVIRCQSPILKQINDDADMWAEMWKKQVHFGLIPYYMFVARDTGPKSYFTLTLDETYRIFSKAMRQVTGLARTVRGPSMSTKAGKVLLVGISEINGEQFYALKFIQARDTELVNKVFYAKYNPDAVWITDLKPAFDSDRRFFTGQKPEVEFLLPCRSGRDSEVEAGKNCC